MSLRARIAGLGSGLLLAVVPAMAGAAEEGSRALAAPATSGTAMLATIGAVAALFLACTLGWLYEQQRGLHWRFQDPDAPAEHH